MKKEMNKEAKEALIDMVQKMNKESQVKRKQSDDLLVAAKILEETAQKLTKEIESITITENDIQE